MARTLDKVSAAIASKEDIRSAIQEKTGEDPGFTLSEYAPKIRAIQVSAVKTVNNKEPDENGNIQLVASDLGISATVENENLTLIL